QQRRNAGLVTNKIYRPRYNRAHDRVKQRVKIKATTARGIYVRRNRTPLCATDTSTYSSATVDDFQPPCFFSVIKSPPDSTKSVADDLRNE
ncbi:unnamed protein product, partial [Acanthoscelides obtectus]